MRLSHKMALSDAPLFNFFGVEPPNRKDVKMKYILKNCPAYVEGISVKKLQEMCGACNYYKLNYLIKCEDRFDCPVKKVIDIALKKQAECDCDKCSTPDCENCVYKEHKEINEVIKILGFQEV